MTKSLIYILAAFSVSLYASSPASPLAVAAADPATSTLKWALDQGGLMAVVVVLLYFWRRDMHKWRKEHETRAHERTEMNAALVALVKEHTAGQVKTVEALRNSAHAIEQMTSVVDRLADRIDR